MGGLSVSISFVVGTISTVFWAAARHPIAFVCKWWAIAHGMVVPASCKILGFPAFIDSTGVVRLGERVKIVSVHKLYSSGAPFPWCSFSLSTNASIEIGDDSYVAFSAFSCRKKITIGKRVLIAAGCRIFDNDAHAIDHIPRLSHEGEGVAEVRIEDDVWLACDVMVCKGVTIGKGSVIGAKSVVTHDIPPGVLAAGIPAKVIRPLRLQDNLKAGASSFP